MGNTDELPDSGADNNGHFQKVKKYRYYFLVGAGIAQRTPRCTATGHPITVNRAVSRQYILQILLPNELRSYRPLI